MKAYELKKKFLEFFKSKAHAIIPSAPLIPEHDPTVLFTTAGMHPLVPFLLGQKHPSGKRLANCQICIRTDDINEVGDVHHLTFFEMLGNWSLGDYFKKEAIEYSFEFLTSKKWLNLDKNKLYISCFKGDKDAPKDVESAKIWGSLGISKDKIYFFGKKENWWGPAGLTGPCGPDTEMFYDTGKQPCSKNCNPSCPCGKYIEIWNDVFMQYNKIAESKFETLKQKNVDTGMGLERIAVVMQNKDSVYETDLFIDIINLINKRAKIKDESAIRIIADHLKAATFILAENIQPSNVEQGYVLRKLIRRSIRYGRKLNINHKFCSEMAEVVIKTYENGYPHLKKNRNFILDELKKEEFRFDKALNSGLKIFEKEIKNIKKLVPGELAFRLFTSYGFPLEVTQELAKEKGLKVDVDSFNQEFKKHQELSRTATEGRFKGGLADASEKTTRLHTAAHLLLAALRQILDKNIQQKGSNITAERLRFDFNFPRKITEEEIKKVEDLVNKKIKESIEVKSEELSLDEAKKKGATGVFEHKYGDKVKVYSINNFSKEICGGPHVSNTKELGKFKITKKESVAAGVRRIKAVLE